MTSQALTPPEYNMSFLTDLSNLFGLSSSDDSYDVTLHFPLMLGDGKVDLSQEDRTMVAKEIAVAVNALKEETNNAQVLAILDRKAKKAAKFNFFLYIDENKEFHVIDYGQGIPATVKDLKVHKKTGQQALQALQDLKSKVKVEATSLKELNAQRKLFEDKILNLPYGVSAYPLEQKLNEVNKAIKAKESFKAKKAKGKGKKAKGKGSNVEFMFGDLSKLRGQKGSGLIKAITAIARLKGYNRVVLSKKKAWFFKVEGDRTPILYLKAKAEAKAEEPKSNEIEVSSLKEARKSLAKKALKQGMLDWS